MINKSWLTLVAELIAATLAAIAALERYDKNKPFRLL